MSRFRPDRDVILFIGADDPLRLRDGADRSRLLSVVAIDHAPILATRDLVPPTSIEEAWRRHRERWDWSLPFRRAWRVLRRPLMDGDYPETLRKIADLLHRGDMTEIAAADRARLLAEPVEPTRFGAKKQERARRAAPAGFEAQLHNAARLASDRAGRAGRPMFRRAAARVGPSQDILREASREKLIVQNGLCALCGRRLQAEPRNRLLQLSIDRIDNADPSYAADNIQIVHFGCNAARNDATLPEWREYIAYVRDAPITPSSPSGSAPGS